MNNNTQDFLIEVIRARGVEPDLKLSELQARIYDGTFEYEAFGIDKEVAISTSIRAFKGNPPTPLPGSLLGFNTEANFTSILTQEGESDAPKTIEFEGLGTPVTGSVSMNPSGEIEILSSGFYAFKQRFRLGRSGASGESEVFFWAESSGDSGNTWDIIGNSIDVALDNAKEISIVFDMAMLYLPKGVKLRNRFARSGNGDDSGDLIPGIPSTTLSNLGVMPSPSAQLTVYKLGNNPVG